MKFCYRFPVVRGAHANKEYYIAMIPLKILDKLFPSVGVNKNFPKKGRKISHPYVCF